ncbi:MAG: hypothetical protein WCB02_08370 [Bradyrhizobium sp.]
MMLKLLQNTGTNGRRLPGLILGAMALLALMSAMPVAPASAQVPADMLRLDPPQPSNAGPRVATDQRAKVRSAYARSRRAQAH